MRRTVTNLPNGIRTLTESDDPAVALRIKSHVSTTGAMVTAARDPNLPMSTPSVHGILQNGAKIERSATITPKGVLLTETSTDSVTVRLLQEHAAEVTDLVKRGMVAAHEAMMKGGGMDGMMGGAMGGAMGGKSRDTVKATPGAGSPMAGMAMGRMSMSGMAMSHDMNDTTFTSMQARGKTAMGVDQYSSTHHFDASDNGGRIALERDVDDSAGVSVIRAHLKGIASSFKSGDFTTPEFVHMKTVPGAAVMTAKRASITYTFRELPRGGELRIVTKDKAAIAAVHEFLAFQRGEHHAN